ncbi:hypothetical protein OQA88_7157 [Cercophora sp. LCS_1]
MDGDLQDASPLFGRLPQEMRNQIYKELFLSTRLAFGMTKRVRIPWYEEPRVQWVETVPARHSLALLRTCRRAKSEIGNSWLGHVTFHFRDTISFVFKLGNIPRETRLRIRRVIIDPDDDSMPWGSIFGFDDANRDGSWWLLTALLRLLPGLQLDELTVRSHRRAVPYSCYAFLDHRARQALVTTSSGWKTLRFIGRKDYLMVTGFDQYELMVTAGAGQGLLADALQDMLQDRDGSGSKPSVTTVCPFSTHHDDGNEYMAVVVKRGSGADYEQKTTRTWFTTQVNGVTAICRTWQDVVLRYFEYHGGYRYARSGSISTLHDAYDHVDDPDQSWSVEEVRNSAKPGLTYLGRVPQTVRNEQLTSST